MNLDIQRFFDETAHIVNSGGWLMIPLVLVAFFIYWTAFEAYFYFSVHKFYKVSKRKMEQWVKTPSDSAGEIANIIEYTQRDCETVDDVRNRFEEVRNVYLYKVQRRRIFLLILISIAPLMGLLGTVTGMLSTFESLSVSGGGDTVDMVAGGISEALITTQTGLIIAIPAYVIAYMIQKRINEMDGCLTHLESMTVQVVETK